MSARSRLPAKGTSWPELESRMQDMAGGDVKWRDGKLGVYIFHAGEDVLDVAHEAYGMFISENGLGPLAFPSIAEMEKQVIENGLTLLNAPDDGCGSFTSGGSESIMLAVKTARDTAKAQGLVKAGEGEIVVPYTAHPAFDKAAHALELKIIRVPVSMPIGAADVAAMEDAITDRTIMMVGSAPNFPYGVVDPIPTLSDLALRKDVWLHVDACVGGYFAPFAKRLGVNIPDFDFTNAGVRSISADLHKYGYAAKGASTVFHRDKAQGDIQSFTFDDWPGGHMYTPNMAGTRPGGAIAAAWAVQQYLGEEGYLKTTQAALNARMIVENGLKEMPGFNLIGDSKLALIAYAHETHSAGKLMGGLMQRGWFHAGVSDPKGLHLMLSPEHEKTMPHYLADLKEITAALDAGAKADDKTVQYGG
ncbi:MAG: pyridoxal phosphate-dependent decarboxylase family protein [Alphaproteobacteria bacterium]